MPVSRSSRGKRPDQDFENIKVQKGENEGKTIFECRINLEAANLRCGCLRDGGHFWSWAYFEQLVAPEGQMASLPEIPRASAGGSARETDALQDILRWCVGRFRKLLTLSGSLPATLPMSRALRVLGQQVERDVDSRNKPIGAPPSRG